MQNLICIIIYVILYTEYTTFMIYSSIDVPLYSFLTTVNSAAMNVGMRISEILVLIILNICQKVV